MTARARSHSLALLKRASLHFCSQQLSRFLGKWRARLVARLQAAEGATSVLLVRMRAAYSHWKRLRSPVSKEDIRVVLAMARGNALRRGLLAVARAAQLPQLVGEFHAWRRESHLAHGLARWREAARNAPLRTPRDLNRYEARALRWRHAAVIFTRWSTASIGRGAMRRAAMYLRGARIPAAMRTWQEHTQQQADPAPRAAADALCRARARRRGYARWRDATEWARLRTIAARRWRGGARLGLMRRWADLTAARTARLRTARAVVQRWRGSLLLLGMERWRAAAARKKQDIFEVGRAFHRKTCRRPLMWRWHGAAARKRTMCTAVRHWRGHAQYGYWQLWTAPLGAMCKAKEQLRQAAGHLLHQRTAKAMRTLIEAQSERRWKQAQLKAGITRLRNGKLSVGWNSWMTMAFERREAMVLMRRSLKFMANRKLAPAFQSWLGVLISSDAQGKRDSMSKALRHLLHRELSRGWVGWYTQWQEAVRKREYARLTKKLLKGGLMRMCNRKLSAGWNSWAEIATERRGVMKLVLRGVLFMEHRKLASAFKSWLDAFGPRAEKAKRTLTSMVKSLRHLLHRELSRGWTEWHVQWQELQSSKRDAQRKRDNMSKALRHMLHRELSRGWTAWAAARQQARTSAKLTLTLTLTLTVTLNPNPNPNHKP